MLNTAGPPIAPSFVPPVSKGTLSGGKSTVGSSLDKFEYLAKHRVGLFRKKVTIANMLSWTKVYILYALRCVCVVCVV